jgi:hypothetical protein
MIKMKKVLNDSFTSSKRMQGNLIMNCSKMKTKNENNYFIKDYSQ